MLRLSLTPEIDRLAVGSQPHRALWDTIAAALLLPALVSLAWPGGATLADLLSVAEIDLAAPSPATSHSAARTGQPLQYRHMNALA